MAAITDFFPRLLPYVPACPDPVAQQALVDSAIHFCEKSLAYRYTPDPVQTEAGISQYDFDLPASTDISRIIWLKIDGYEVADVAQEQLRTLRDRDDTKPTRYYVTQNESEALINLHPTPDDVYDLTMSLALRPTRNATRVEDDLYTYWQDAIIAGALYRLMQIPDQPFSDPVNAAFYGRRAAVLTNNARNEGNLGRVTGSLKVRPRPFI